MIKTTITGAGGILAIITLEKVNVVMATVIGVLTLIHLIVKLSTEIKNFKK